MTLERTSDSSRGPAVEYGPGPAFEALVRAWNYSFELQVQQDKN